MDERSVAVSARVTLTLRSVAAARAVEAALAVDNPARGFKQSAKGKAVTLETAPASARSTRETLEDWLRCASAAEAAASAGARRANARP